MEITWWVMERCVRGVKGQPDKPRIVWIAVDEGDCFVDLVGCAIRREIIDSVIWDSRGAYRFTPVGIIRDTASKYACKMGPTT